MEKFTPLAKKFTLPPAVTAWTNSTSVCSILNSLNSVVSGGSNVNNSNSVNIVNSVQAVYSLVLPASPMVFFYLGLVFLKICKCCPNLW